MSVWLIYIYSKTAFLHTLVRGKLIYRNYVSVNMLILYSLQSEMIKGKTPLRNYNHLKSIFLGNNKIDYFDYDQVTIIISNPENYLSRFIFLFFFYFFFLILDYLKIRSINGALRHTPNTNKRLHFSITNM